MHVDVHGEWVMVAAMYNVLAILSTVDMVCLACMWSAGSVWYVWYVWYMVCMVCWSLSCEILLLLNIVDINQ